MNKRRLFSGKNGKYGDKYKPLDYKEYRQRASNKLADTATHEPCHCRDCYLDDDALAYPELTFDKLCDTVIETKLCDTVIETERLINGVNDEIALGEIPGSIPQLEPMSIHTLNTGGASTGGASTGGAGRGATLDDFYSNHF